MPTNDLTYTVTPEIGSFTSTQITLAAHLPVLTNGDTYNFFEIIDISNTMEGEHINALLIYMKRSSGNDSPLKWGSKDPDVPLPVITAANITPNGTAPAFDWSKQEALIMLYHEPKKQQDIEDMKKDVPSSYQTVKKVGPFCTVRADKHIEKALEKVITKGSYERKMLDIALMFYNPRTVGMTIIRKS